MPQGYPQTPSTLVAHGAHTPMASLTPHLSGRSRNPALDLPHKGFCPRLGPSSPHPAHSLCTYWSHLSSPLRGPMHSLCRASGGVVTLASILRGLRSPLFTPESSLGPSFSSLSTRTLMMLRHVLTSHRDHVCLHPEYLHTHLQGASIQPVLLDGACAVLCWLSPSPTQPITYSLAHALSSCELIA